MKLIKLFLLLFILSVPAHSASLGYKPTPQKIAKKFLRRTIKLAVPVSLPTSVDLCDQLPPVGNQGSQGSCVAWATGYYYKSFQEGKEHGWDFSDNSQICSPAFIYNQINGGTDGGSYPYDAFLLIQREGCDNLADMPYDDTDYLTLPTKEQMLNAINWRSESFSFFFYGNNDQTTGRRYTPLSDTDINNLKAHLSNGDVFVMGIPVYSGFFNLNSTNYFYDDPSANETYEGGHAIVICGYDDNVTGDGRGGFKLRNSWGTSWGNNGEAYISYDFVKNYAYEAVAMVDRIGYSWNRVADFDVEELYRGDLNATVSSNGSELVFMGDYLYQQYGGDNREGIHVIFDVTELGEPEEYYLNLQDINNSSNSGYLSGFYVHTIAGKTAKSFDPPLEIPLNGVKVNAYLNMDYPQILSFTANPQSGNSPLSVEFYYHVGDPNNDTLTCYFDFDGDGSDDFTIENCISGNYQYTYEDEGTYNATIRVSDGVYSSEDRVVVQVNDEVSSSGSGGGGGCQISNVPIGSGLINFILMVSGFSVFGFLRRRY